MARPVRVEYPGAFYHITARGNERKDIFRSARDREKFLSYLQSATQRYGAAIHVYCLMSNHYHLLLETPEGNLSQIMRHINGAYTSYFNTKRRRAGHLFQGRYKGILVEADEYAEELSRYIHLNPVRAGMVEKPEDFQWSSYAAYVGKKKSPDWLVRDFILAYFDGKKEKAERKYQEFVQLGMPAAADPLSEVVGSFLLGSETFIRTIREKFLTDRKDDRNLPVVRQIARRAAPEKIDRLVENVFTEDAALGRKARLYLYHTCTAQSLKEIGSRFGIKETGVSQASRRFSEKMASDSSLRKKINGIKGALGL